MRPSQKPGTAWPITVASVPAWSTRVLRLTAVTTPSGTATTSVSRTALAASSSVAGRPLQHRALEVQLQQHAQRACQPGVHRHGEVQGEHVAGFEQLLNRRQRPWVARFEHACVGRARGTKGRLDGRVVIEERQEDDQRGLGQPRQEIRAHPGLRYRYRGASG